MTVKRDCHGEDTTEPGPATQAPELVHQDSFRHSRLFFTQRMVASAAAPDLPGFLRPLAAKPAIKIFRMFLNVLYNRRVQCVYYLFSIFVHSDPRSNRAPITGYKWVSGGDDRNCRK